MIRNPFAPSSGASPTVTRSTRAYAGPVRHQSTSSPARSPSKCPATEPSGSLRTQPVTPSRSACRWVSHRNETPWTRPEILTVSAMGPMMPVRPRSGWDACDMLDR